MGGGLVVTVALDLALIPPFGATGAAIASAVAYVTSTLALSTTSISAQQNGVEVRATSPAADGRFSIPFLAAGTYKFSCTVHPAMTGTLTVQ